MILWTAAEEEAEEPTGEYEIPVWVLRAAGKEKQCHFDPHSGTWFPMTTEEKKCPT